MIFFSFRRSFLKDAANRDVSNKLQDKFDVAVSLPKNICSKRAFGFTNKIYEDNLSCSIQEYYRACLDASRSYALLNSIEFSFHFDFVWYPSFVINFPRFFKRLFRPMKILLRRHSQNNYQIWFYKLNLMCEELFYQIINISAVNQAVFCYC